MDNEEKNEINFDDDTINNDDKENIDPVDIYSGTFKGRDSLSENNIVDEIKKSFLDYSMSVITSRALPDLRDGLKPVHRRILWSMYKSGYTPDKPHRKSAKTVGEVMGNYHPMVIVLFMRLWLEWLRILIRGIYLLMGMVILVILRVMVLLQCVIPSLDYLNCL